MTSRRVRAASISEESSAESGFTLIELIVAMAIFAIFMSIFLAAVIGLTRGTIRVQHTAQSTGEALIVFQNLDRQIRYADAINAPGDGASGARYFEFRVPATSTDSGVANCRQWRFQPDTGNIQSRQWDDGAGSVPTGWSTKLATALDLGEAGYPFNMIPATLTSAQKQQFELTIDTGRPGVDGGTAISTSFVARNSSLESPSNTPGGSVCQPSGRRP